MKKALAELVTDLVKEKYALRILYAVGIIIFLSYNLLSSFRSFGEQQFFLLAKAFLQGHFSLGTNNVTLDGSYYHGLVYWPQGPFPALLLTPFVLFFGDLIHQGNLQFFLNMLNLVLLYKIALKITKNQKTALWLSFGYIFATVYLVVGLISWSWWYAQVVATSCLLLLVYEYFHKKRWLVMGIYVALGMMSRIDLIFALFFPLVSLFFSKQKSIRKIAHGFLLISPLFFGLALLAFYNLMRFGSIFEFGYRYHTAAIGTAESMLRRYGAWSLFYVPTNLYYLFLKGIDAVYVPGTKYLQFPFLRPDVWGMSIFLTSPILLWCFKSKYKEKIVRIAGFTVLVILLFLLGYFGIGSKQYGYRYALDFQPFLFIILCYAFQSGMSRFAKIIIVFSFAFNLVLLPSIFLSTIV